MNKKKSNQTATHDKSLLRTLMFYVEFQESATYEKKIERLSHIIYFFPSAYLLLGTPIFFGGAQNGQVTASRKKKKSYLCVK